MAGTSPAMTDVESEQVPRLLRFARNDVDGVFGSQQPSLRGARSATKQSLPHGPEFQASRAGRRGATATASWRNEPEISFWRNEPENRSPPIYRYPPAPLTPVSER